MSVDFRFCMVVLKFGINRAQIHPVLYQQLHVVSPLVSTSHLLNTAVLLLIFFTTVYPSSDGCFQKDNVPCHKAQIT